MHKDHEKSTHEEAGEPVAEMPKPDFSFETGGNGSNPSSGSGKITSADVTWQHIYIYMYVMSLRLITS